MNRAAMGLIKIESNQGFWARIYAFFRSAPRGHWCTVQDPLYIRACTVHQAV